MNAYEGVDGFISDYRFAMGLECSAVAMEHDLCTNIRVIDVCTEFDMFEVKVPIIFFQHSGFFATQRWMLVAEENIASLDLYSIT